MKYIYKKEVMILFPDDVDRIVRIFRDRGFEIEREDAHLGWREHSRQLCAGWLILNDDDDAVFDNAKRHLTKVES